MDAGAVLRPHSTVEGGEAQGPGNGAATIPTGGKGETSGRIGFTDTCRYPESELTCQQNWTE